MSGIRRGERFGAGSQEEMAGQPQDDGWKQMLGLTSRLPLSKSRRDGGTQPRAALDEVIIDEYAEAMREGAKFPPVDVFYDGQDHWLADGFHRIEAAESIGQPEFDVETHQGTRRDAVLFSVGVNAEHGLRRTNADKRRAVLTLLHDPEWSTWSNSVIARHCHVDEKTVRIWRDSSLTPEFPESEETREQKTPQMRTGADGREYRVDRIQKKAQKRAARKPSTPPSEPPRNLDESEPPGIWQDRPAQPRGLYQPVQPTPPAWTAQVPAERIELSLEVESDDADRPLTPEDIRRSVLDHLQAAAEGLSDLGLQEDADNLLEYISDRRKEWKLKREEET